MALFIMGENMKKRPKLVDTPSSYANYRPGGGLKKILYFHQKK